MSETKVAAPDSGDITSDDMSKKAVSESPHAEAATEESGVSGNENGDVQKGDTDADTVPHSEASSQEHGSAPKVSLAKSEDGSTAAVQKSNSAPTRCAKVFNGLSKAGPLVLLVAIALMVWPEFWYPQNALYCPPEVATISTFLHSVSTGTWLVPTAPEAGAWNLPQWPVFYWFIWLLALIPNVSLPDLLLPLSGALSAFMAVLAVWVLALCAGFGLRAAFAAGIIALCAPLLAPLPHFIGASALSSFLLVFSLALFAQGWRKTGAWLCVPGAFVLAGLAGLCGGPVYLALPLIASFFYLIWCGNFGRIQALDALAGFALLLLLVGGWLAFVILGEGSGGYLSTLFADSWHFSWPLEHGWWLAMLIAGVGLIPWLLIILGVSWGKVLGNSVKTLAASRKENGSALIWITLVLACAASLFMPAFQGIAVAIICIAAPLLGKAFINLGPLGNRFFFLLAAICLICAGAVVLAAGFATTQQWLLAVSPVNPGKDICDLLLSLKALPVIGGICLVGGLLVLAVFARRNHQGGGLVFSLVLTIILCQPVLLMLVPELGASSQTRLENFQTIEKRIGATPASPLPSQNTAASVLPDASSATEAVAPPVTENTENVEPANQGSPDKKDETSLQPPENAEVQSPAAQTSDKSSEQNEEGKNDEPSATTVPDGTKPAQ